MEQGQESTAKGGVSYTPAPVVAMRAPGAEPILGGWVASLLVGESWPQLIKHTPRVTSERIGWRVRVRVWWPLLAIKPGAWASPGFMDVPLHSYLAMRVRAWWRRKPLPRARMVQR